MKQAIALQFTSPEIEGMVRQMLADLTCPFSQLEETMNRLHVIVPAGSLDVTAIDIGARRIVESPSPLLDQLCGFYLQGCATLHGMDCDQDTETRREELRKRMGVESDEEFEHRRTERCRRNLPPRIREALRLQDRKRKVRLRLRIVK